MHVRARSFSSSTSRPRWRERDRGGGGRRRAPCIPASHASHTHTTCTHTHTHTHTHIHTHTHTRSLSRSLSDCPGVNAPGAGKADACAGCPNQATCADTEATTAAAAAAAADAAAVAARLAGVKAVLLVLSGKGGVGKSTLAAQLALALAGRGRAVGLVDLDVCGPSAPGMAGVGGRDVHASGSGWAPVYADEDAFGGAGGGGGGSLAVMSIGFLLPDPDGAVVWRGPRKHALITKFFRDVDWGALDVLVVDTPPGTSDEHMAAAALLLGGGGGAAGGAATGAAALPASPGPPRISALIVTTPQEVALADVRKEVSFCKKVK